jgi:predicted ester cyclase
MCRNRIAGTFAFFAIACNIPAFAESPHEWRALSAQTRAQMKLMDETIRDPVAQRSYDRYLQMFAPDVVAHGLYEGEEADLDRIREHYRPVFFELTDGVLLSDDVIVAGRMAAQRYHSMLYLQGEFDGVEAVNRAVFLRGQTFFRFNHGMQIVERWSNHDHAFRLTQLKGEQGALEGERLAAVLNGPGLSEQAVRNKLAAINAAFNLVQMPPERESQYLRFFADDVRVHGIADEAVGIEALRRYQRARWRAFPDIERALDAELSAWSYGAIRWRALASHRDDFGGLAASNRPVRLTGEAVMRFDASGKVVEIWINDAPVEPM